MNKIRETMLAPKMWIHPKTKELSPTGVTNFINSLTLTEVDKLPYKVKHREDHSIMYLPVLAKDSLGTEGRASITLALPDSGNLLAHAAVDADFHAKLGIPIESTKIKAKAANRQSMDFRGVPKGMYIRFPNITRTFLVKPLVVENLPCELSLLFT